ncbi:conserved hypothetcial protein, putative [Babesia bigemina]|uniref:Crossover junction endonuclease MUS81 n=1 Tax=Babesia bigemina TaxID=5866 RepID=A0A061D636_BABBI|nr:conserved hypothetcial protein, putative [Babesia bigemina]CDR96023.1 conserved hypothetcial protein, putative [Babesia bigemina]|eukprot:XP_012768209.1 conserved hypothetcial protein, putative [Babesia bigemina]
MAKEEGRRLKRGLSLVHPSNHSYYRFLLSELERWRRIGNRCKVSSLNRAVNALERYPMPIYNTDNAVAMSGVGLNTTKVFERAIEKHGVPVVNRTQCAAYVETVLGRIRSFIANTEFDDETVATSKEWRPVRYSSAWTFIMVLGLYADGDTKLSVETILQRSKELIERMPKCRLTNLDFVRTLVEKSIVDFVYPAKQDEGNVEFNSKKRRFYLYGLTQWGQTLAEEIISGCEVPISNRRLQADVFSQTQRSQQVPPGVYAAIPRSQAGTGDVVDISDDQEHTASASDYYSEYLSDSDEEMEDILVASGNSLNPPGNGSPTSSQCQKDTDVKLTQISIDEQAIEQVDPNVLLSFKCNDPSQYVGDGTVGKLKIKGAYTSISNYRYTSNSNHPSATGKMVPKVETRPLPITEVCVISDSTQSLDSVPKTAGSNKDATSPLQSQASSRLGAASQVMGSQAGAEQVSAMAVGSQAGEATLQDINCETPKVSDANTAHIVVKTPVAAKDRSVAPKMECGSEGFRTPDPSSSADEAAPNQQTNDDAIGKTGEYLSPQNGEDESVYSDSPYSDDSLDITDVTSDRYRRLMDDYHGASQCYSQSSDHNGAPMLELGSQMVGAERDTAANDLGAVDHEATQPTRQHTIQSSQLEDTESYPNHPSRSSQLVDTPLAARLTQSQVKRTGLEAQEQEPIEIDSSSSSPIDSPIPAPKSATRSELLQLTIRSVAMSPQKDPPSHLCRRLQSRQGIAVPDGPEGYEVVTVVDNREVNDADGRYKRRIVDLFSAAGKPVVFRQLPLGDVIWVLRRKNQGAEGDAPAVTAENDLVDLIMSQEEDPDEKRANAATRSGARNPNATAAPKTANRGAKRRKASGANDQLADSFVLDWVLERKTTVDLAASICDGRYDDQKIRLLRLIGFKHVCYVFEDIDARAVVGRTKMHKGVNAAAITSARVRTQMVTGFNVLRTTGMPHTAASILAMHRHIESRTHEYMREANTTSGEFLQLWIQSRYMPLAQWKVRNRKRNQLTFRDLFGKQLRAIPGCSEATTEAMLAAWPTPYAFAHALSNSNLAHINETLGKHRRRGKRAPVNSSSALLQDEATSAARSAEVTAHAGQLALVAAMWSWQVQAGHVH